jgi:MFS family permease
VKVYGDILRSPHVAVLMSAVLLTRLPFAINGLAILLFLRAETGSFGVAGLVVGALTLGAAAGQPFGSRVVDRRGTHMLIPLAVVNASALLGVWALGSAGAPTVALALVAALAGASYPPAGAVLRSRYPELIEPRLVHGAYALDSVSIEAAFVTGPLVTAVIVAVAGPAYALALSAAFVIVGTVVFNALLPPAGERHAAAAEHRGVLGPMREPGILMIALATVPVGFCLGVIEVSLPAFAEDEGVPALAGVLLAIWSGASAIGGLVFGATGSARPRLDSYLLLAALFPLACLPLIVGTSPATMIPLVVVAGLPVAPLIASRNLLVDVLAPRGTMAESFTWLMTALVTGLSAGTAVAGALVEAEGWVSAVILGCAVAAVGAAIAFGFRHALRPRLATS